MKTYYRVQADIDLDAIYKNAENAKKLTKPGTKFMAIVKADAYGHGAIPVAKVLDPIADAYGVAILEEGIELRQAGITKPILILGFTPAPLYPSMIEYDIATAVFQYDMAKKMSDAAVQLGKKAKIQSGHGDEPHRVCFDRGESAEDMQDKSAPGDRDRGLLFTFCTHG